MAQFNLEDYETVEDRLRRFWALPEHSDARIMTFNRSTEGDRSKGVWVVEARIYLSASDQAADLPKATGWAFEVDGGKGPNATSALENCETSSIGRCLANMNFSGNKRASREEMSKVAAGEKFDPKKDLPNWAKRNWVNEADNLHFAKDKKGLQALYLDAKSANAPEDVLAKIVEYGQSLA